MNITFVVRAGKAIARRRSSSSRYSQAFSTRLFSPKNDIWIRRDVTRSKNSHDVGLTPAFLDDIIDLGDVDSITREGNELHLKWSGLKISDGDELYHCSYENVHGKIIIPLPRNANVTHVMGKTASGTLTSECALCVVDLHGDPEWA